MLELPRLKKYSMGCGQVAIISVSSIKAIIWNLAYFQTWKILQENGHIPELGIYHNMKWSLVLHFYFIHTK